MTRPKFPLHKYSSLGASQAIEIQRSRMFDEEYGKEYGKVPAKGKLGSQMMPALPTPKPGLHDGTVEKPYPSCDTCTNTRKEQHLGECKSILRCESAPMPALVSMHFMMLVSCISHSP